jgi:hypothetical protein
MYIEPLSRQEHLAQRKKVEIVEAVGIKRGRRTVETKTSMRGWEGVYWDAVRVKSQEHPREPVGVS